MVMYHHDSLLHIELCLLFYLRPGDDDDGEHKKIAHTFGVPPEKQHLLLEISDCYEKDDSQIIHSRLLLSTSFRVKRRLEAEINASSVI